MAKTYGGWAAYGNPQFDGSSVSGGKPVPSGTSADRAKAAKVQKGYTAVDNCRKCKPEIMEFCGKHAKNAAK